MLNRKKIRLATCLFVLILPLSAAWAQGPEFGSSESTPPPAPAPGRVWSGVRVVDVHGWEQAGVSIRWVGGGEALQLHRADGSTKTVRPDQIAQIYDAAGNDITTEVADARRAGSQPDLAPQNTAPWPSDDTEVGGTYAVLGATLASAATPQVFNFAVDGGLGYATHAGTWFGGLDDGTNYQAGLRVMVSDRNYLRLIYRNQDLGQQTMEIFLDEPTTIAIDFTLREYQLMVGMLGRLAGTKTVKSLGYLEYGMSVMEPRISSSGGAYSETKLGLAVQGGVLVLLNKHLAFDFSGGVTWKMSFDEQEGGGFLMGAHLALVFLN